MTNEKIFCLLVLTNSKIRKECSDEFCRNILEQIYRGCYEAL